jgi:hypothetical protein
MRQCEYAICVKESLIPAVNIETALVADIMLVRLSCAMSVKHIITHLNIKAVNDVPIV